MSPGTRREDSISRSFPPPHHPRAVLDIGDELFQGIFRLVFAVQPEPDVHEHGGGDDRGVGPFFEHGRQDARTDEDEDERAHDLLQGELRDADGALLPEIVAAEAREALCRLLFGQAVGRGAQLAQDFVAREKPGRLYRHFFFHLPIISAARAFSYARFHAGKDSCYNAPT
ncbi:MAG: hypothetical protein WDN09_04055 [bacterium]